MQVINQDFKQIISKYYNKITRILSSSQKNIDNVKQLTTQDYLENIINEKATFPLLESKLIGKEYDIMRKAKMNTEYLEKQHTNKDIIKLYEIFNNLEKAKETINIEEKVLQFSSPQITKIIDRYNILCATTQGSRGTGYNKQYEKIEIIPETKKILERRIYMDAPVGLILAYNNTPVAITTFAILNNTLKIYQLQGITEQILHENQVFILKKFRTKGLFDLDWKKMLVTINEDIAKYFEIETCSIQSAENNPYTQVNCFGEITLSENNAKKIYDLTAESLGYVKAKDNDWYKKLT